MVGRILDPKAELERRQAVNKWTAKIVPLILIGIVGYATWVVVVLVGAHYLIDGNARHGLNERPATGIAIVVVYFVLLLSAAICYFRLLDSVREPGYIARRESSESTKVERREQPYRKVFRGCTTTQVATRPQSSESHAKSESEHSSIGTQGQDVTTLDLESIFKGELPPPPGLENYYSKQVFACDPNGLPIWCGTCSNWKPDRAHHCSDVGRCVMKLDHFCPWVGGVVAERNFKFFIQFNSYTCLYTLFILITMAYFVHDRSSHHLGLEVNWIIILALAGLFTLFTAGMAGTSIHLALNNLTTIDNINHEQKTMFMAVYIDDPSRYYRPQAQPPPSSDPDRLQPTRRSTQKSSHSRHTRQRSPSLDRSGFEPGECTRLMFQGSKPRPNKHPDSLPLHEPLPHPWTGTITYPLYTNPAITSSNSATTPPTRLPPPRTFAILRTRPGMNPWNLGPLRNWKSVMGDRWPHWFLPLHHSPCCRHEGEESLYALGPDVERLKQAAGISESSPPLENASMGASMGADTRHKRRRGGGRRKKHRPRQDASPDSMASSTMANVDGVTGRGPEATRSSFSVSADTL